ncbi:MAG: hypothetical protein JKY01_09015 [Pseudomonadales bacterium]|nr:hypothetical protein [Pseudomonadales bacterium]
MGWVTVAEAAKMVGKANRTIYARITKGDIASRKNSQNKKEVQVVDLIKCFGEVSQKSNTESVTSLQYENNEREQELNALRVEVARLKGENLNANTTIGFLQTNLDKEIEVREAIQLRLKDMTQKTNIKKGLFHRIADAIADQ